MVDVALGMFLYVRSQRALGNAVDHSEDNPTTEAYNARADTFTAILDELQAERP